MRKRLQEMWGRCGWIECTFVALLLVYGALRVFAPASVDLQALTALATFVFALMTGVRLSRSLMRRAIWRLRNRLLAAYLFIAVVPISLLIGLAGFSGYQLIGQVAAYLVRTQLANQQARLLGDADMLVGRFPRGVPGRGMYPGGRRPQNQTTGGGPQGQVGQPNQTARAGRDNRPPSMLGGRGQAPWFRFGPPPTLTPEQQADSAFTRADQTAQNYVTNRPELEVLVRGYRRPVAKDAAKKTPAPVEPESRDEERRRNEIRYPAESKITPPPSKIGRDSGLAIRTENGRQRLFLWAHSTSTEGEAHEATLMLPVTGDRLSGLVPQLSSVWVDYLGGYNLVPPSAEAKVPPPVNILDSSFVGWYVFPANNWNAEEKVWGETDGQTPCLLRIRSRLSTVLNIIFEQQQSGEKPSSTLIQGLFLVAFVLFLMAEIASVWAGVKISRTMTGAVHELYEGTQRIKEGDFKYRIPVKGDDQLAELCSSFNTMTENLGNLVVVAKEKERLQSELEIAREVQKQLFPRDVPSVRTLELKGVCKPARVVSGDYYDFLTLPGSEVAFAIGDVAGKGISAALLMASIQSAMRMQLNPANGVNAHDYSAASLVSRLNRQLYATTTPEKYATFYFALYDEAKRALTYTNAGHLSPLLVRHGDITPLTPTGTVVGAFPFAKYEERTIELQGGDILLAYTDGIVEPENAYGEMFGENRLKDLLLRYAYADSAEIIARSMEAVNEWTGSSELQDDMTMIVARQL